MTCPNGDPAFNRTLSAFITPTPANRRAIFYGVCIWARLALYAGVYYYRNAAWLPYVIGLASLMAINQTSQGGTQWWSRNFHLGISIAVATACALRISGFKIPSEVIPALLFASLLGGFAYSLTVKFC